MVVIELLEDEAKESARTPVGVAVVVVMSKEEHDDRLRSRIQ